MQLDWWTLALQTVNFAVLLWLMHRFLYKPVLRMVDARRSEIDRQMAEMEKAKAEVDDRLAAAEAERQRIAGERESILDAARREAEAEAAARHEKARQEAESLLAATRRSLDSERDAAQADVRRAALDIGGDVARRLLDESPPELCARAWLARIESHLAALPPEELQELREDRDGVGVRIVSAEPLPEDVMTEWRKRIGRLLPADMPMRFEADADLVAGVELHFPNAVVRFSWQSVLQAMEAEISGDDDAR